MGNAIELRAGIGLADLTAAVPKADPERDARLSQAEADPMFFARTYLPHYFTDAPCDFHRELCRLLFDKTDDTVIAAPRGHAKSTIAALLYPLHEMLFGRRHYVLIIRKTMRDAEEALEAIRHELESNERLVADFGSRVQRARTRAIRLAGGVRIVAMTRGSKIRGTRSRQYRPDLIICDDLEDDDHIESSDQREKDEKWFASAISNACGPEGRVIVIGTILHAQSLLSKLLDNPAYTTRRFAAVLSWPDRADMWDRWRETYRDRDRGKEAARHFFGRRRSKMMAGARVLWPGRWPLPRLMAIREKIGSISFEQELQNNPNDPKAQLVREEWIRYYDPADLFNVGLVFFGACDPSIGRREHSDEAAIVTVARGSDGFLYVWKIDASRRSVLSTAQANLRHEQEYHYAAFGIEVNAYQTALAEITTALGREQKIYPPIVELTNVADKSTRFASISPLVENGTLRFRRDQFRLIEQLCGFPKWEHDDIFDALEMAVRLARTGPSGPVEFTSSGKKFAALAKEVW